MNMTIDLGPFNIQMNFLIVLLAAILGYGIILLIVKRLPELYQRVLPDLILTTILIPVLVWKFGPLFLHPIQFIHEPILGLFSKGTKEYWLLGFVISLFYFAYRVHRNLIQLYLILDVITVGVLVYLSITYLFIRSYGKPTQLPWGVSIDQPTLHYHPVNIYHFITILIIGIWFLYKRYRVGEGRLFTYFLILFGIGNMIITYTTFQQSLFVFLSLEQWTYLIAIFVGGILPIRIKPLF